MHALDLVSVWLHLIFALVIVASAVHDFAIGPRAALAIAAPLAEQLRGRASLSVARTRVFALRGWPWG